MTIYSLDRTVYAKLFKGFVHFIVESDFDYDTRTVSIELDSRHYLWRVTRARNGDCVIQYSEGTEWHELGVLPRNTYSYIAFDSI